MVVLHKEKTKTVPKEAKTEESLPNFPIKTSKERTSTIVGDEEKYNITIVSRGGAGTTRGTNAVIVHTCL